MAKVSEQSCETEEGSNLLRGDQGLGSGRQGNHSLQEEELRNRLCALDIDILLAEDMGLEEMKRFIEELESIPECCWFKDCGKDGEHGGDSAEASENGEGKRGGERKALKRSSKRLRTRGCERYEPQGNRLIRRKKCERRIVVYLHCLFTHVYLCRLFTFRLSYPEFLVGCSSC